MKQFLDRFDQSSIWVRIFILALLMFILMMGLTVARSSRGNYQHSTSITAPSKSSSSSRASSDQQVLEEVEQFVKRAEEEQNEANLRSAKEKVDALPDGEQKSDFLNRLQAVAAALGLDLQALTTQSSVAQSASPAVGQATTNVEQPTYVAPQYVEQPSQPTVVETPPAAPAESTTTTSE